MANGARPPLHLSDERISLRLSVPAGTFCDRAIAACYQAHAQRGHESDRTAIAPDAVAIKKRDIVSHIEANLLWLIRVAQDVCPEYTHGYRLVNCFYSTRVCRSRGTAAEASFG